MFVFRMNLTSLMAAAYVHELNCLHLTPQAQVQTINFISSRTTELNRGSKENRFCNTTEIASKHT